MGFFCSGVLKGINYVSAIKILLDTLGIFIPSIFHMDNLSPNYEDIKFDLSTVLGFRCLSPMLNLPLKI